MTGTMLFETTRLTAHRLDEESEDALFRVYGDAGAMRWVGDGRPISRAECARWIEVTLQNYAERGYGMTQLLERDSARTVGFIGLVHPGGQHEVELKYALARDCWGQGLATEAAAAMLDWGLRRHGIRQVTATIHPDNLGSQRVAARIGMTRAADRIEADGSVTRVYCWRAG